MTSQELLDRIQEHVEVPWQSQRPDGFPDGIRFGSGDTIVTGIVTTYTPSLKVLRHAVDSRRNTLICREMPFYSRGERAPVEYRNGPAPSTDVLANDPVCKFKSDFISQNNLVIIRFVENWDARNTNGQLRGLARALNWEQFHVPLGNGAEEYNSTDRYFVLAGFTLGALAENISKALNIECARVIGKSQSSVRKVALAPGLLLVSEAEEILSQPDVDVIVAGDAVEWEVGPYFQDLVTGGQAKGLILIGDEASEDPGCGEVAMWLKSFVTDVPVQWFPAGDPFRKILTAKDPS